MKTITDERSHLLKWTFLCLKYFLIVIFGFAIAYMMSISFGVLHLAAMLLPLVGSWFWRVGILLLCLLALAVILESLR
ncbi:MAG: hypothetical protein KME30_16915 [Iphinoe sp. HA4291-MV1]|jgi:lipopolysaccharide export LptBFGC system permease protein LptF|nr:hypothetical protein [Iphinoe sp. HA4291-MV1]